MPLLGPLMGMDQPVPLATKRYLDVLLGRDKFEKGRTYTSKPHKLVGPLQAVEYPHILDEERQEIAWSVLDELTSRGAKSPALGARA